MEFIINSTLVTVTGLLVVGAWLLTGYAIMRLWYYLLKNVFRFSWKSGMGIFGGLLTAFYLLGYLLWVAFLNLMPDID
jgi:hypothetical protein